MAQIDAQAEERTKALDNEAEARMKGIEARYQAQEHAVEKADAPAVGATEELVDIVKQRAKYQSDAQTRLDKLNIRLQAEQQKIQVLGGRAPSSLQEQWQTASTEYSSLQQDVGQLEQVSPDRWAGAKEQLESRISDLDERVKKLNDAIEGV
ncbi:MAG: hypothetical protein JWN48_5466 [Myxococcaceae bacterium]|nr:hypothetical protein [Myxococcaceae bacterium]